MTTKCLHFSLQNGKHPPRRVAGSEARNWAKSSQRSAEKGDNNNNDDDAAAARGRKVAVTSR